MTSLWTREELLEQIAETKGAIKSALSSQSYGINNRSLTRQRIADLRAHLSYLESQLAALEGKGRGPVFVTARPKR